MFLDAFFNFVWQPCNRYAITDVDCSIPLKSAVAAILYMEIKVTDQAFPGLIADQADWWKNYYNSDGITNDFITKVENYENVNSK